MLHGFSAGGLVAAALLNEAPHLVAGGVVLQSPFVDLLNSMLDPDIPLVVGERHEWADPLQSQEVYFYLKAYSPYDNLPLLMTRRREAGVSSVMPPHVLVTGSADDARVMFWEPIKYVQRMRQMMQQTVHCSTSSGENDDSRSDALDDQPLREQGVGGAAGGGGDDGGGGGGGGGDASSAVVLLRMHPASAGGHGANQNAAREAEALAFEQAFILSRLGVAAGPLPTAATAAATVTATAREKA